MPVLDLLLLKNPILRLLDRLGIMSSTSPVVTFAKARMAERLGETSAPRESGRGDLLSMFLKAKEDRPDFFHDGRVLVMAVSMAFAGSETTAISLAAVFYHLLKNPRCHASLVAEIDGAIASGRVAARPGQLVSWAESQTLPYLDACIKEAFRLHPAAGLPLERYTPPGGVDILGRRIPGGTIVGCSAWVVHRRPEVFGPDVDAFRPERWLEAGGDARKEMEAAMFQFGAGARTCIGKNISLLEMYKVVPSLLHRFEACVPSPPCSFPLFWPFGLLGRDARR
jgi:cytochrome P450